MNYAGTGEYYTQKSRLNVPIGHCRTCDVYCRDVSAAIMDSHRDAASYVQLENEARFLTQRREFFKHLLSIAQSTLSTGPHGMKLVDFGSSYGHLLSIAKSVGFEPVGIESNDGLIKYSRWQGLQVFPTLDALKEPVDVFLFIDSLYYLPDPKGTLNNVVSRLKPTGIGVIRVTNRNLFARINMLVRRSAPFSVLGDAIVSYSVKGLRRLLDATGLEVVKLLPDTGQKKKDMNLKTRLLYAGTTVLTALTLNRVIFTPGIIAVVRLHSAGQLRADGNLTTASSAHRRTPECA